MTTRAALTASSLLALGLLLGGGALVATPTWAQAEEPSPPPTADPSDPADPAGPAPGAGAEANVFGEWSIDAEHGYPGCTFSGTAIIQPGPSPDVYQCSLVIHDVCPMWNHTAQETCVARRAGDTLSIQSRLDSVDPPTNSYYPDHFSLTIIDGSNMKGALLTEPYNTNARFHRENGPVS